MSSSGDAFVRLGEGRLSGPVMRWLGLPVPKRLRRETGAYRSRELHGRAVAVGPQEQGATSILATLESLGATPRTGPVWATDVPVEVAVFDATGCGDVIALDRLRSFFGPLMRQLAMSARLVVIGKDPGSSADPVERGVAAGLEGFVRTLAKEVGRRGATANLLYVHPDAMDRLLGPLRFLCSHRSAYVSGRVLRVSTDVPAADGPDVDATRLAGRLALVTGAARGLGAATARRLAEEGARVICVDVPSARDALERLARDLGGLALPVDITAQGAPGDIVSAISNGGGKLGVLVHNAGITRDRMLVRMSESEWASTMAVNLQAVVDIDAAIDHADAWDSGAREICLSSISGIAGNVGQANYATSKAALMGYAAGRAVQMATSGMTVNCVAPGFIETEMTQKIPLMIREAGRRLNALSQAGQPGDVAEAVVFLALAESAGITGQTLRVCGQALMGA